MINILPDGLKIEEMVVVFVISLFIIFIVYGLVSDYISNKQAKEIVSSSFSNRIKITRNIDGEINREFVLAKLFMHNGIAFGDNGNIYIAGKDKILSGIIDLRLGTSNYYKNINGEDILNLNLYEIVLDNSVTPAKTIKINTYFKKEEISKDGI